MGDAALPLEAARVLEEHGRRSVGAEDNRVNATLGLYPIIATFLPTGGRKAEVLGLDVEDVRFDRGLVRFRPNAHRRLETETSLRDVPLWPQLRQILQEWMYAGETPRTSGLLFPSPTGGTVHGLRKSLDAIARLAGMDEGEVRTRRFRHTYCSARLQTVQRIVKPGKDPATDSDPYEWVEVSRFTVQKEMGHGGAQLVDRIYGHAQRPPTGWRWLSTGWRSTGRRSVIGGGRWWPLSADASPDSTQRSTICSLRRALGRDSISLVFVWETGLFGFQALGHVSALFGPFRMVCAHDVPRRPGEPPHPGRGVSLG